MSDYLSTIENLARREPSPVVVAVDLANLFINGVQTLDHNGFRINYERFITAIRRFAPESTVYFFFVSSKKNIPLPLETNDVSVITTYVSAWNGQEKGVDQTIASIITSVTMQNFSRNIRLILVSGDGDYGPMVDLAAKKGTMVTVLGWRYGMSSYYAQLTHKHSWNVNLEYIDDMTAHDVYFVNYERSKPSSEKSTAFKIKKISFLKHNHIIKKFVSELPSRSASYYWLNESEAEVTVAHNSDQALLNEALVKAFSVFREAEIELIQKKNGDAVVARNGDAVVTKSSAVKPNACFHREFCMKKDKCPFHHSAAEMEAFRKNIAPMVLKTKQCKRYNGCPYQATICRYRHANEPPFCKTCGLEKCLYNTPNQIDHPVVVRSVITTETSKFKELEKRNYLAKV